MGAAFAGSFPSPEEDRAEPGVGAARGRRRGPTEAAEGSPAHLLTRGPLLARPPADESRLRPGDLPSAEPQPPALSAHRPERQGGLVPH